MRRARDGRIRWSEPEASAAAPANLLLGIAAPHLDHVLAPVDYSSLAVPFVLAAAASSFPISHLQSVLRFFVLSRVRKLLMGVTRVLVLSVTTKHRSFQLSTCM